MSGVIKPSVENDEVEIVLDRGDTGLGFNIQGGTDSPYLPEDYGVFVVKIRNSGSAYKDGRLKEGDKIISINASKLEGMTHVEAVNCFLDAGEKVTLVVIPGAEAAIVACSSQSAPIASTTPVPPTYVPLSTSCNELEFNLDVEAFVESIYIEALIPAAATSPSVQLSGSSTTAFPQSGSTAQTAEKRDASKNVGQSGGGSLYKMLGLLSGVAAVGAVGFMVYKHYKPRTS